VPSKQDGKAGPPPPPPYTTAAPTHLTGTFDNGGKIGNMVKDMHLALTEAQRLGVPMWVSNSVAQIYNFAATQGSLDEDSMVLIKYMERWAGVEVRKK